MTDLTFLWGVVSFIVAAVVTGIIKFYTYKSEQDNKLADLTLKVAQLEEKLKAQKEIIDHLTKAGENLKTEFSDMRVLLGEIRQSIKQIERSLKID